MKLFTSVPIYQFRQSIGGEVFLPVHDQPPSGRTCAEYPQNQSQSKPRELIGSCDWPGQIGHGLQHRCKLADFGRVANLTGIDNISECSQKNTPLAPASTRLNYYLVKLFVPVFTSTRPRQEIGQANLPKLRAIETIQSLQASLIRRGPLKLQRLAGLGHFRPKLPGQNIPLPGGELACLGEYLAILSQRYSTVGWA
jgi:hypothetical protein